MTDGRIYDLASGKIGEPTKFENGETLTVCCNSYAIHDVPNYVRWIRDEDAAELRELDQLEAALNKRRKRVMARAYLNARPMTPEEARKQT